MSEIVTLTGSKFKAASTVRPAMRLVKDGEQADAELLAPVSDAIFQIGAHAAKLAAMLGDRDEACRLIDAELQVRLGFVENVA
jgi:hypothetical protein